MSGWKRCMQKGGLMRGEQRDVSKTVRVPKDLDAKVFSALARPGMEDVSYSDIVRDSLYFYLRFLQFNEGAQLECPHNPPCGGECQ